MIAINWPDIFNKGNFNLAEDTVKSKKAAALSLKLLLQSERLTLFGDPGYGVYLRRFLYDLNNSYLISLIREEIYEAIRKFIPLIDVQRSDITFTHDYAIGERVKKNIVYVNIVYRYVEDSISDTLKLTLVEE